MRGLTAGRTTSSQANRPKELGAPSGSVPEPDGLDRRVERVRTLAESRGGARRFSRRRALLTLPPSSNKLPRCSREGREPSLRRDAFARSRRQGPCNDSFRRRGRRMRTGTNRPRRSASGAWLTPTQGGRIAGESVDTPTSVRLGPSPEPLGAWSMRCAGIAIRADVHRRPIARCRTSSCRAAAAVELADRPSLHQPRSPDFACARSLPCSRTSAHQRPRSCGRGPSDLPTAAPESSPEGPRSAGPTLSVVYHGAESARPCRDVSLSIIVGRVRSHSDPADLSPEPLAHHRRAHRAEPTTITTGAGRPESVLAPRSTSPRRCHGPASQPAPHLRAAARLVIRHEWFTMTAIPSGVRSSRLVYFASRPCASSRGGIDTMRSSRPCVSCISWSGLPLGPLACRA